MSEPEEALASGWERDGIHGVVCVPVWYRTKVGRGLSRQALRGTEKTDFLFYGLASDCAFEPEALQQVLGVPIAPVLTRVDARSSLLHAYVCEAQVGAGRLLLTTLRPYGGLGDQPSGLKRAICGVGLLHAWLEWLIR